MRCRSTCPIWPGFGDSSKPGRTLDVPELADALAGWIGAMRLAPVALLGNSFGCQVIADLAARQPGLVERALLQGRLAPPEERSWLWQFIRWGQNQPYNPAPLSPITWDDYRKCGYPRLLRTFQYQLRDPIEAKPPQIQAPSRWYAASMIRSAAPGGRPRSPSAFPTATTWRSRTCRTRWSTPRRRSRRA